MTAVTPVARASTSSAPATGGSTATPSPPSVMPPPAPLGGDPLSMMYLFESQERQLGLQTSSNKVHGDQAAMQNAFDKEQQEIKKAENDAAHESFWHHVGDVCGDVAKVAGVVASIAVAVGTAGAATPFAIAAAALSVAAFTEGETHVLEALGVNAGLANAIDEGLSLASVALSAGTLLFAGAAAASQTAADVGKVATVVSAVGHAGHGATIIAAAVAQKHADESDADAAASDAQQRELRRIVQQILQAAQNADAQDGKTLQIIAGVKNTQTQTAFIAATGMRG
ncbi:MAG TPA: hypothetical protein VIY73_20360 [Polyangiaceae bacterium]